MHLGGIAALREIGEAFAAAKDDDTVKAVILTGSGEKAFVAGADINELAQCNALTGKTTAEKGQRIFFAIERFPKPVIAAVNGFAFGGGCELSMLADIIVAGEGASFGQPEIRVGIMPGAGGTQRLTRAVGKYRAMKMLLTGEAVPARYALVMGLVSEVVPDGETFARALAIAKTIAAMPPLAVMQIKDAVLADTIKMFDNGTFEWAVGNVKDFAAARYANLHVQIGN